MYMVTFNTEDWRKSTCSCPKFFKKYICKHVLGIAIDEKLVKPPKTANTDVIGPKRKRGRKPNAKKALLID